MDPNAALDYCRQAVAEDDHQGLVEAFEALDG